MPSDDLESEELLEEQGVTWSSKKTVRNVQERRSGTDRRHMSGRTVTVPDMRIGKERRSGADRRKVRLVITGRAIDV